MAHKPISRADSKSHWYGNAGDSDEERSFIGKDRRRLDKLKSEQVSMRRKNADNPMLKQYEAAISKLERALPPQKRPKTE